MRARLLPILLWCSALFLTAPESDAYYDPAARILCERACEAKAKPKIEKAAKDYGACVSGAERMAKLRCDEEWPRPQQSDYNDYEIMAWGIGHAACMYLTLNSGDYDIEWSFPVPSVSYKDSPMEKCAGQYEDEVEVDVATELGYCLEGCPSDD